MKQTNWDGREVLLVEVPENTTDFIIDDGDLCFIVYDLAYDSIKLPECNWQPAFADPLSPTEEEAGEWVDGYELWAADKVYNNYDFENDGVAYFTTRVESLHSRIRSEGFDPNRTVLLIKK